MHAFLSDLALGLRGLVRRPAYALATVATLALGAGATTAMFSVVNGVLLRPLPYPEPDRILRIEERHADEGTVNLTGATFHDLERRSRSLTHLAVMRSFPYNLSGDGLAAEAVTGTRVSEGFFQALGVRPAFGRLFLPGDFAEGGERVLVLSRALFERWAAGDRRLIGRRVRLDGEPCVVVGVLPARSGFPEDADLWLPMSEPGTLPGNRHSHLFTTLGRLRPSASLGSARAELGAIARRLRVEIGSEDDVSGFAATPLQERMTAAVRPALLALMGAVGLLLAVACVNLSHLLLARGVARSRELAVRAALGAGRGRIVRQLLTETLALALLAVVPAVLVALLGVRGLLSALPADMPRLGAVSIDLTVLGFALAVAVGPALVFGVAPALLAARTDLRPALAEGGRGGTGPRRGRLRSALVAAEVALLVVLVAGAGLLGRTLLALGSVPLGLRADGVLTFYVAPGGPGYREAAGRAALADESLARLRRLPGVERAAVASGLPTRPLPATSFALDGRHDDPATNVDADVLAVSADYFRLLEIPVLEGRAVQTGDALGAPTVAVLSRAAAEAFWPGRDPLGHRLELLHWDTPLEATVVGVVEDVREHGPAEPIEPAVYFSHAQFADRVLGWHYLLRASGDPASLAGPAQAVARRVDPDQPPSGVATLESTLAGAVAGRRLDAMLLALFAAAALLLVVAGISGVVFLIVAERTREIGVRVALGATGRDVAARMATHVLGPVAGGLAAGFAAALLAGRAMAGLLFGVASADPATLLATGLVVALVAAVSAWLPARRAARVDPLAALRSE